jgi:hypothetical protein
MTTQHIPHYLACAQGWACSDGHINAYGLFLMLGIALAGAALKAAWDALRKKAGLPPPKPRQPADISPFTAGLLGDSAARSYYPRGITAVTPHGTRTRVRCPHKTGHRTPELAVSCGHREKARIETLGR